MFYPELGQDFFPIYLTYVMVQIQATIDLGPFYGGVPYFLLGINKLDGVAPLVADPPDVHLPIGKMSPFEIDYFTFS